MAHPVAERVPGHCKRQQGGAEGRAAWEGRARQGRDHVEPAGLAQNLEVEEFVLDFFAVTPYSSVQARGTLVSRVVTSPPHFKRIVAALEDNLEKYEAQFGDIEEPRGHFPDPDDIGFVH